MRKNWKEVKLTWKINPKGNWNRNNGLVKPVYTKPITQIFIDGDEFVWKHEEILELIKAYHESDVKSIEMIKKGDSGEVTKAETTLLEKIKDFVNKLEAEKCN